MKKKFLILLKEKIQVILIKKIFFKECYNITVTNVLCNKQITEIYIYILAYDNNVNFISILNKYSFFIKKELINCFKLYKLKKIFFIFDDNVFKSIELIDTLDGLKSE